MRARREERGLRVRDVTGQYYDIHRGEVICIQSISLKNNNKEDEGEERGKRRERGGGCIIGQY